MNKNPELLSDEELYAAVIETTSSINMLTASSQEEAVTYDALVLTGCSLIHYAKQLAAEAVSRGLVDAEQIPKNMK